MEIIDLTAENYQNYVEIQENDKGVLHIKMEQVLFDSETGKRHSKPKIGKFSPKVWDRLGADIIRLGYTIEILYDPRTAKEKEHHETAQPKPSIHWKTAQKLAKEQTSNSNREQADKQ